MVAQGRVLIVRRVLTQIIPSPHLPTIKHILDIFLFSKFLFRILCVCLIHNSTCFTCFRICSFARQLWKWNWTRRSCHSARSEGKPGFHWCHYGNRANEDSSWIPGQQRSDAAWSCTVQESTLLVMVYHVQKNPWSKVIYTHPIFLCLSSSILLKLITNSLS